MLRWSGSVPPVQRITWEPWIFCVWNQISRRSASLHVSLSFWRLLRPTRIRRPAVSGTPWAGGPLEAGLLFAPAPKVAALRQLGTDVVEVLLQLRLLQLLHHALQIGELLPALFQLLRQDALRRLGLGILLEVAGGVLLRRQQRIQTDIQLGGSPPRSSSPPSRQVMPRSMR